MATEPNIIVSLLEGMNATRWGLLGLGLFGLELITGTTYILWPAAAALILAVLAFLIPMSWEMQFILFFILSIVLLYAGHRYLRPLMKSGEPTEVNDPSQAMLGRRVVAFSDFESGHGRVTVGDTQWSANTDGDDPKKGDRLVVTSVAGTTLIVEPAIKA